MRPGQAAPVFIPVAIRGSRTRRRFNEAGAGCPGIRSGSEGTYGGRSSFNEAGAGCPGIPEGQSPEQHRRTRFNEAGAGCPGIQTFLQIVILVLRRLQ